MVDCSREFTLTIRSRRRLRTAIWLLTPGLVVCLSTPIAAQPKRRTPVDAAEAPFLAEDAAAMTTMMRAMTITPSSNVDVDFTAMMIPHHQGAMDMAEAELRHGRNETLRRIAQEIVVEQQQEIAAMRLALGQPLPPSVPSPTQAKPGSSSASQPVPSGGAMSMSPHTKPMKVTATQ